MTRVLFVCTGNLCRSPIAEGLMRRAVERDGAACAWHIDSAGIHARAGLAPTPLAVAAAAEYGADIAGQRSRRFENDDFARFEWIVALDAGHFDRLGAIAPASGGARIVMLEDATGNVIDVPDPFGAHRRAYVRAAQSIASGIEPLVARIAALNALDR